MTKSPTTKYQKMNTWKTTHLPSQPPKTNPAHQTNPVKPPLPAALQVAPPPGAENADGAKMAMTESPLTSKTATNTSQKDPARAPMTKTQRTPTWKTPSKNPKNPSTKTNLKKVCP